MPTLPLSTDELLATTRAVRRHLDLRRPVERRVLEECLALAQQAPTGSNMQSWHFVVVTDPAKKAALADLYRQGMALYRTLPMAASNLQFDDPARTALQERFTAMPIVITTWAGRPDSGFRTITAAAIVVLLTVVLLANTGAILLRNHYEKKR